jgi:deoxyribonuclease-4
VASHVNDSKIELNGHKDRHEQIGDGLIGKQGIKLFTQHSDLQHVDLLLETPDDDIRAKEVKMLQKWRNNINK